MTVGISPKAVLAFFYPFIATVVGVGVEWLSTGKFDKAEVITGIAGVATSGLALLGAYVGKPGPVK